jgi:hypothetical protein
VEIIPAYIRQGGAAEQGFDVPVHDVLDVQGNAFRGARYEDVILSVCAGVKANAVHAAPLSSSLPQCTGSSGGDSR